jgi:endonuclease-3 related protein
MKSRIDSSLTTATKEESIGQRLLEIYHRLLARYGPQHWWPAEDPFEVIVGAILTQAAAWGNVEQALSKLKAATALTPVALRDIPLSRLTTLIRPCGYYNAKAVKLKAFVERLGARYGDDLGQLFALEIDDLRQELLSIHGVGEETADSIILYAARKPVFVIDAYTRRIIRRLGLAPASDSYRAFQALFTENLPAEEGLFNEYHALLVRHGKEVCRKVPRCQNCCLRSLCPY